MGHFLVEGDLSESPMPSFESNESSLKISLVHQVGRKARLNSALHSKLHCKRPLPAPAYMLNEVLHLSELSDQLGKTI
jgi:hypothetical protein